MGRGRLGVVVAVTLAVLAVLIPGAAGAQAHSSPVIVYGLSDPPLDSVWVEKLNGSQRHRLGIGLSPKLSADGDVVATATRPSNGLAMISVYRTQGGLLRRWKVSAEFIKPLGFSPDDRYLAVSAGAGPTFGLQVFDLWTGKRTLELGPDTNPLSNAYVGASFSPSLPDRIVYPAVTRDGQLILHVRQANGTGPATTLVGTQSATSPVWGPAGIAFSARLSVRASGNGFGQVLLWRRPGDISTISGYDDFSDAPVAWSANGDVLALAAQTWTLNSRHLSPLPQSPYIDAISANGRELLTTPDVSAGPQGRPPPIAASLQSVSGGPAHAVTPVGTIGVDSNF